MSDDQRGSGYDSGSAGDQPNPFSRAGSDGDDAFGSDQPAPPHDEAAGSSGSASGASAWGSEQPGQPSSWPSYPPAEVDPEGPQPGNAHNPHPASPYQAPYGSPSPNPMSHQPPPPGFDTQPTSPYGSADSSSGYPAAPYGQPAPSDGSNPYELNPYQPSYGGYSPYGVPPGAHPKSTPALIFGIIGLVLAFSCGVGGFLGIGGIINGRAARADIDADPQRYTGRSSASAGFGLGIAAVVVATLVTLLLIIGIASGAFDS